MEEGSEPMDESGEPIDNSGPYGFIVQDGYDSQANKNETQFRDIFRTSS
jgi:hypothetical protein